MVWPMETEIVRMRIQKEVEGRFRMEIEGRQNEIERISDAYYEIKRQNEIFKTTIENIKYESEMVITELKNRHKSEISELLEQNHALHLRVDDSKDKDVVRSLRRELEEHKRRN
jgi:hypothetical protein